MFLSFCDDVMGIKQIWEHKNPFEPENYNATFTSYIWLHFLNINVWNRQSGVTYFDVKNVRNWLKS